MSSEWDLSRMAERLARLEEARDGDRKFLHQRMDDLDTKTERRMDRIEATIRESLAAMKEGIEDTINGRIQSLDNKYSWTQRVVTVIVFTVITALVSGWLGGWFDKPPRAPFTQTRPPGGPPFDASQNPQ